MMDNQHLIERFLKSPEFIPALVVHLPWLEEKVQYTLAMAQDATQKWGTKTKE